MRELVAQYLSKSISRRGFVSRLAKTGVSLAAAQSVVQSLTPLVYGKTGDTDVSPEDIRIFQGTGGEAFAEQLIASGVKYIFGNSASSDAYFYEALVDRPQLTYILTPHEAYQEEIVGPLTKWHWLARRSEMIPETIRRAFKVAWTPPYGPTYATWHTDYTGEKVRTEIIRHEKVDPRMRVRPNPKEVERAAEMLVEAKMPLLMVGDELYKTNSADKAVKLAELLGMPVTEPWQVFANFPQTHPLFVGGSALQTQNPDVVINVGNKLQHFSPRPVVPRHTKFIDMRIDSASVGNIITTDVPLVADVGYGLDDLITAIEGVMTPTLRKKAQERAESIVDESGGTGGKQFFEFNPMGGREHIAFYAGHLGGATGKAAGVKMARPKQQVIALAGDGAFIFGPTGLWNQARLELPVINVIYNNHAYGGPHNRVINAVRDSRMVQEGRYFCDYLGKPDMNMAYIAKGFGVEGEVVQTPDELKQALARAKRATLEGKPYLIDAQVRRTGVGWAEEPWVPTVDLA
jgi:thiamine pyrophosphate-dependent acetolactate synthase large subunit-like protein